MKENIPTFFVFIRFLAGAFIFMMLRRRTVDSRGLAFLAVSLCILLDTSDGWLQRELGLNPPWQDGVGDASYIIGGFLGLWIGPIRDDRGVPVSQISDARMLLLLLVWIILTATAYATPDSLPILQKTGMAGLHIYYAIAGIWLWYRLLEMALLERWHKYLPATLATVVGVGVFLDYARFLDYISGRP